MAISPSASGPWPLVRWYGLRAASVIQFWNERGRPCDGADRLAVAAEDAVGAAEAEHLDERGDPVDAVARPRTGVDERRVEEGALVALERVRERDRALDLRVDRLVGGGEEVVEGAADGVGEHERAGHEGHAEHDRDDRGDEASLVLPQGAAGEAEHQLARRFICSMIASAVGSCISSTMRPSARNRARSA